MEHIIRKKFKERPRGLRLAGYIFGGLILAVIFAFLFGYFAMLLWNWLMPAVFGLGEINYWQAVGIIILARLVFGGFGHGHSNHKSRKKDWSKYCCDDDKYSKWKHYNDFWKEEGEHKFEEYLQRKENEKSD